MMSIIILVGSYRYYAGLAERFGKKRWYFGLLAIGVYLGFQMMFLFSYEAFMVLNNPDFFNENKYSGFSVINIINWLFGIGGVLGIYKLLEYKFKKGNISSPALEIEEIVNK
ncbi:hypothetical protein AB4Y90_11520 [Chryseobacterium sp. 2TAF14]|uniref:hypothetical protein n=1 Tax=Chryseobacterium sp. 2TAF14 TaxID=3233007 RepID=UPI003F93C18E